MPLRPRGYSFGPYLIDAVRRLVWMDGQPIPVSGKAFEILLFLVEQRPRVVEKDDLLKAVWPDTFVQENNLVRHVSTLRRALGQRADQHDYILTVQGRGYQFVAAVAELDAIPDGLPTGETAAAATGAVLELAAQGGEASTSADVEAVPSLRRVATGLTPASAAPRATTIPWMTIAAAGLVFAIVGAAWLARAATRAPAGATAPALVRQITYGPSAAMNPTWSPDGGSIAYASDRSGNFDIWLQRLDGAEPVQVTHSTAEDWQPAWSPDGRWLAYRSEDNGGGVFIVSANGGMVRRISQFGYHPQWSPDGTRLIFVNSLVLRRPRPRLFVVSVDGGPPQDIQSGLSTMTAGAWTPDGKVSLWSAEHGSWAFVTVAIDGQRSASFTIAEDVAKQVHELELEPARFRWAPDGRSLVFDGVTRGSRHLWRVGVDRAHNSLVGPLERLTTSSGSDGDSALSPNGARLAYAATSERTRIFSFAFDAEGKVSGPGLPVTAGGSGEFDAAVSDDGQRIIYRTTRDGRQEVWERSLPDGKERRLISGGADARTSPRWSPDGTRLAYQVTTNQPSVAGALAVFALSDLREQVLTPPGASSLVPDDWSRDGSMILGPCENRATSTFDACVALAAAPSAVRSVAAAPNHSLRSLRFSPDQRWISAIAYPSNRRTDLSSIVVVPFGGGPVIQMTDGQSYDQKPVWSKDGRTLYFVSNRDGFFNVWARHFEGQSGKPSGAPFRVTSFRSPRQLLAPDLTRLEISVVAERLYVPVTERTSEIMILDGVRK